MAYQLPIKYFNSFWLKKVVGASNLNPEDQITAGGGTYDYESTVTTYVEGGLGSGGQYFLPTWPGLPWGWTLNRTDPVNPGVDLAYPCFPWGGGDWNGGTLPPDCHPGDFIVGCDFCGGSLVNRVDDLPQGLKRSWFVEEARIRGGFNNTSVSFGVKAFLVDDINEQQHRISSLIYSGIFNSRTGVNNTNVFSTAEAITKSLDPSNGSIQKLYAYDTNLTVFQENKVSKALIDKDAIYSAEGVGTPVSSTQLVIGQIVPYIGEYGISTNPESWAQFGFRQYFADVNRGTVLRLSRDGITEIGAYGMTDWFRDNLSLVKETPVPTVNTYDAEVTGLRPEEYTIFFTITNQEDDCDCSNIPVGSVIEINGISLNNFFVVDVQPSLDNTTCTITANQAFIFSDFGLGGWNEFDTVSFLTTFKDKVRGGFDTHNKNYTISLQTYQPNTGCIPDLSTSTLGFDEAINGWVSFYDYSPLFLDSLKNEFFTGTGNSLYKHYSEIPNTRGTFYGQAYPSSIEFIFNNNPSLVKNFLTVGYEGSSGWMIDHFVSDATEQDYSPFSPIAPPLAGAVWYPSRDITNPVLSYVEGIYFDPISQQPLHAGFDRKENRYVANLINTSSGQRGEVVFGGQVSGIKGYFATVKLSTDNVTDIGGMKELYAVNTEVVKSS